MERKPPAILLPVLVFATLLVSSCYHVTFEPDNVDDDDALFENGGNTESEANEAQFTGIDLLIVIDNSTSMAEEQKMLSTSLLNLGNAFLNDRESWPFGMPEEVRIGIVSSDLGLQYGTDHSVVGFPYGHQIVSCTEVGTERGDNGKFQTFMGSQVMIESGQVDCIEGADQCPSGWSCESGTCHSPSGIAELVSCPDENWVSTTNFVDTHIRVACMAELGTLGCGVEQQLEASVRGLTGDTEQGAFVKDDHLLVVLVVSDEEDCSIADKGLFETKEWGSGTTYDPVDTSQGLLNVACNYPESNGDFLFDTERYYDQLVSIKNNDPNAVIFAAIVGVPRNTVGEDQKCEGQGNNLVNCLAHPSMQLELGTFTTETGTPYRHFKPACERVVDDQFVTLARPGRRYVEVAQSFGQNSYVYSICNKDWSPAMRDIAEMAGKKIKK